MLIMTRQRSKSGARKVRTPAKGISLRGVTSSSFEDRRVA